MTAIKEVQIAHGRTAVWLVTYNRIALMHDILERVGVLEMPASAFHLPHEVFFAVRYDGDVDWVGRPAVTCAGVKRDMVRFDDEAKEADENRDDNICREAVEKEKREVEWHMGVSIRERLHEQYAEHRRADEENEYAPYGTQNNMKHATSSIA